MDSLDDEAEEILGTLQNAKRRMEELQEERDALLKANDRLIDIMERIEEEVREQQDEEMEAELLKREEVSAVDYDYSFGEGWHPKKIIEEEQLDLDGAIDPDKLDAEIGRIKEMVERIRSYKNQ